MSTSFPVAGTTHTSLPSATILSSMRDKRTEELLGIWVKNDRSEWTDQAFAAVLQVLTERGMVPPPQSEFRVADRSYEGVGGWLLLLCICLAVLRPIAGIAVTVALAASGQEAIALIVLAISIYSCYAGLRLWRRMPAAVRTAKQFLWATLGCEAAIILLAARASIFDGASIRDAAGVLLFFAIGYSYLRQSKRVLATYADA